MDQLPRNWSVLRALGAPCSWLRCCPRAEDATSCAPSQAGRSVEKQIAYLDEVRKWAETVKGYGERIAERSARIGEELRREVDRLDAPIASMRRVG